MGIYTVVGEAGAGKTTLAVSLACAAAGNGRATALVSANVGHGELQVFFNVHIGEGRGTFAAINDGSGKCVEKLTPTGEGLHILAVADEGPETLGEPFGKAALDALFNVLAVSFDVIIIDGKDDMANEITLYGLLKSEKLVCVHKADSTGVLWNNAHRALLREFPVVDALNGNAAAMTETEFQKQTGRSPMLLLPRVPEANDLKNRGLPIYLSKGKAPRAYAQAARGIAREAFGGRYG